MQANTPEGKEVTQRKYMTGSYSFKGSYLAPCHCTPHCMIATGSHLVLADMLPGIKYK